MATTLRLPPDLETDARARCERLGISLNALVCVALDAYLRGERGGLATGAASGAAAAAAAATGAAAPTAAIAATAPPALATPEPAAATPAPASAAPLSRKQRRELERQRARR